LLLVKGRWIGSFDEVRKLLPEAIVKAIAAVRGQGTVDPEPALTIAWVPLSSSPLE
jgi:hypothetical protein